MFLYIDIYQYIFILMKIYGRHIFRLCFAILVRVEFRAAIGNIISNWCHWWWNVDLCNHTAVVKSITTNWYHRWWNCNFCKWVTVRKSMAFNRCHWWWNVDLCKDTEVIESTVTNRFHIWWNIIYFFLVLEATNNWLSMFIN